mmetsp:Transcript_19306/g.55344  ORF Transcript_19306/g.55344 Transcript_19306/m.55344 type:complete len:231 (-) Transcript_19306:198-890(-)
MPGDDRLLGILQHRPLLQGLGVFELLQYMALVREPHDGAIVIPHEHDFLDTRIIIHRILLAAFQHHPEVIGQEALVVGVVRFRQLLWQAGDPHRIIRRRDVEFVRVGHDAGDPPVRKVEDEDDEHQNPKAIEEAEHFGGVLELQVAAWLGVKLPRPIDLECAALPEFVVGAATLGRACAQVGDGEFADVYVQRAPLVVDHRAMGVEEYGRQRKQGKEHEHNAHELDELEV